MRLSNAGRDVDAADLLCYRQQYLETKSQVQAYISRRSPHLTAVITAAKGTLLEVSTNCSFPSILTFSRQRETARTETVVQTRKPATFPGEKTREGISESSQERFLRITAPLCLGSMQPIWDADVRISSSGKVSSVKPSHWCCTYLHLYLFPWLNRKGLNYLSELTRSIRQRNPNLWVPATASQLVLVWS